MQSSRVSGAKVLVRYCVRLMQVSLLEDLSMEKLNEATTHC